MLNFSSDYPAKFHAIQIILYVSVNCVGEKTPFLTIVNIINYNPIIWPLSIFRLFEKFLKFISLILLSPNYFHVKKKNVYSMPCVPNPHPPKDTRTHVLL